jgi:mono/diheme cytochrome c family protein
MSRIEKSRGDSWRSFCKYDETLLIKRGKRKGTKPSLLIVVFCLLPCAFTVSACRQDMHDNPRYEAYEDGAGRQVPEGTVARGSLDLNPSAPKAETGRAQPSQAQTSQIPAGAAPATTGAQMTPATVQAGGTPAGSSGPTQAVPTGEDGFPFKVTREILDRGESRFNISCAPCHGKLGDGNGMIVQRGFRRPPNYTDDRLMKAPSSHFYDVMTNGFGAMSSYADQLTPEDRWKVIAYIRVLQLSQRANAGELAEADKKGLEEAEKKAMEKQKGNQSQTSPSGGHSN